MSEANGAGEDVPEKKWSGYSDYEEVASQLHKDVRNAVEAFSHIDSKHSQGIGVTPKTAVKARSAILSVAKRLAVEVRRNQHVDELGEIHERWSDDEEADEEGLITKLERSDFRAGQPDWLGQLVDDIIEAAWELGYIKAGVEKSTDPTADDAQVREMFE